MNGILMNTLTTQLLAMLLFYRSIAPFTLLVSGLILYFVLIPAQSHGWRGSLLGPLLLKLATAPVVWYLSERARPNQYWFYYNLHLSRRRLWAGVLAFDYLLFLVAVLLLRAALS